MEKTTEIDRTLSYIVEQLDYYAVNSKHSIKKNGEYGYIIIRDVGDIGHVEYAITSRIIRRMSECESIRDAMIRDIGCDLSFAGMMLVSRRARGVGGDNLSRVIAQDHAPGHARAMSKFSEFGKTDETAFGIPVWRFWFKKLLQIWVERRKI